MQDGLAVGGRRVDGGLPDRATLDADDAADRVGDDGSISEVRTRTTSSRPCRGERAGVVAGALRGDPEAGVGGGADHGGDLGGGAGERDGGRALVDGDVPGEAGGVVPGVPGQVDAAVEQPRSA